MCQVMINVPNEVLYDTHMSASDATEFALRQSSDGWHENQNDYSAFIMEFLTTVYMCYKEPDKRFAVAGSRKVTKQARVEATILNSLTPVSKTDIRNR